jgi:hypothetical protein
MITKAKITLEQFYSAFKQVLDFEKRGASVKGLKNYITTMNTLVNPTPKYSDCPTCAALTKRLHSDFQHFLWTQLNLINPLINIPAPVFKSKKMATAFWNERITISSFEHLRNLIEDLRSQSAQAQKKGDSVTSDIFKADSEAIRDYMNKKINFFSIPYANDIDTTNDIVELEIEPIVVEVIERKSTSKLTDKNLLITSLNEGKSYSQIGLLFDVDKSTVAKWVKTLKDNNEWQRQ